MSTKTVVRNTSRVKSFEDLRGLRGECYVRDSTPDQRDGFGPDIQRHNEERFSQTYGIILGDRWYTEFVSGRNASKRHEFQQILEDARLDRFDVLLVDHTSRFGRNQAECIRYKEELNLLDKIVVFVSQGIISGSDRDFLNERINETLDEQYSRNLSRYVSAGLAQKAEHGLHVGPAPFGFKSELLSGKPERKVQDPLEMPALILALRDYDSGNLSYRDVANDLNTHGFRTRAGRAFTGYAVRDILSNRFYEGKVVYHKGLSDEKVIDGSHEVPAEVKELWLRCQNIRRDRDNAKMGHPRGEKHDYPFSRVLKCHLCGHPFHGEAVHYRGKTNLRLTHERRAFGRACHTWPRSRSVDSLNQEFNERVLSHIKLDNRWKPLVSAALQSECEVKGNQEQSERLKRAIENLRKQHLWGHISDDDYRQEMADLERQLHVANPDPRPTALPNMEKAAEFLSNLPILWSHQGVTNRQRESLVQEVFAKITADGNSLVSVEPKPSYRPLFAAMLMQNPVGYYETDSSPSPPSS